MAKEVEGERSLLQAEVVLCGDVGVGDGRLIEKRRDVRDGVEVLG